VPALQIRWGLDGLDVEADTTKYVVLSQDHNAGRVHQKNIYNSSCEMVEQFKYLGTTIPDQTSIQQEIKSTQCSGNVCYHSV